MVGVVVRVDEVGHLVADTVVGSNLVHGTLNVVTDGGRCVEQDYPIRGGQERRLVGAVSDPIEIPLDSSDVVSLLVQRRPERRARDRRVIRQVFRAAGARVGKCLGCRVVRAHSSSCVDR